MMLKAVEKGISFYVYPTLAVVFVILMLVTDSVDLIRRDFFIFSAGMIAGMYSLEYLSSREPELSEKMKYGAQIFIRQFSLATVTVFYLINMSLKISHSFYEYMRIIVPIFFLFLVANAAVDIMYNTVMAQDKLVTLAQRWEKYPRFVVVRTMFTVALLVCYGYFWGMAGF